MEKYFLEIINLLIENNTEQTYRKIMLSILDIIIENPILCMSIYKPYINSAENYWRYYDETIDNLEKYRKEVIEIARLKNGQLAKEERIRGGAMSEMAKAWFMLTEYPKLLDYLRRLSWI